MRPGGLSEGVIGGKRGTLGIESPVAAMAGIGPKRAAALEARGIATVGDVMFHLPARYQDWRERTPS